MLLTLILFAIVSDVTFLLCLIGAIPGYFWGITAAGAAVGHTGRLMGVFAWSRESPEPGFHH